MLSSSGATAETLERFYEDLRGIGTSPLWLVQEEALVAEPKSKALPFLWRWSELQPQALRAGDLIGTADAERRVLMLLNPGLNRIATTNSMFAGLQIVMPGEAARAHRHTPAALRFIINSQGGSTTVNGDRIPMFPGDLVLTPNWTWHDHANDTEDPIIWLDGLDIPLVHMLEAVYYEPYPEDVQPVTEPTDSSLTRYGAGTLRPTWETSGATHLSSAALPVEADLGDAETTGARGGWEPVRRGDHGIHQPEHGRPGNAHHGLPHPDAPPRRGHQGPPPYRRRHLSRGAGPWPLGCQRGDPGLGGQRRVPAVPGWNYHEHANASDTEPAVLFSFTEAPVLKALSLLREQAHPEGHQ